MPLLSVERTSSAVSGLFRSVAGSVGQRLSKASSNAITHADKFVASHSVSLMKDMKATGENWRKQMMREGRFGEAAIIAVATLAIPLITQDPQLHTMLPLQFREPLEPVAAMIHSASTAYQRLEATKTNPFKKLSGWIAYLKADPKNLETQVDSTRISNLVGTAQSTTNQEEAKLARQILVDLALMNVRLADVILNRLRIIQTNIPEIFLAVDEICRKASNPEIKHQALNTLLRLMEMHPGLCSTQDQILANLAKSYPAIFDTEQISQIIKLSENIKKRGLNGFQIALDNLRLKPDCAFEKNHLMELIKSCRVVPGNLLTLKDLARALPHLVDAEVSDAITALGGDPLETARVMFKMYQPPPLTPTNPTEPAPKPAS